MAAKFLREGHNHSVYVNRAERKSSSVPRHREVNDFLARKISTDLQIPKAQEVPRRNLRHHSSAHALR
jgi:mRNA interferase HicA